MPAPSRRASPRRWYQPPAGKLPPPVYISDDEMLDLAWAQFGPRWMAGYPQILYPSDAEYYCAPIEEAQAIITASHIDKHAYAPDVFDCDDFCAVLKANFCQAAYAEGTRLHAYCLGTLWVNQPYGHALNWMINADRVLRLVDPQNGRIFPLEGYGEFYLATI
jgi:Agglutinin C-terminal